MTKTKTQRDLDLKSISAVFFDVGATLVWPDFQAQAELASQVLGFTTIRPMEMMRGDRVARRFANSYLADNGFGADTIRDDAVPAWYAAFLTSLFSSLHRRRCRMNSELNELIQRFWQRHQQKTWMSVIGPEVTAALDHFIKIGMPLGVISNTEGRLISDLADLGLESYFITFLDSGVEKVAKPDPRIFRRAVRRLRLDLRPSQCLYVGDLPSVDILGARRAGLRAVLYDPAGVFDDIDVGVPRCRSLLTLAQRFSGCA